MKIEAPVIIRLLQSKTTDRKRGVDSHGLKGWLIRFRSFQVKPGNEN